MGQEAKRRHEKQRKVHRTRLGRDSRGAGRIGLAWAQLRRHGASAARRGGGDGGPWRAGAALAGPGHARAHAAGGGGGGQRGAGRAGAGPDAQRAPGDRARRGGRPQAGPRLHRHRASAAGAGAHAGLRRRADPGCRWQRPQRAVHGHNGPLRLSREPPGPPGTGPESGPPASSLPPRRDPRPGPVQPRPHAHSRRRRHRPRRGPGA